MNKLFLDFLSLMVLLPFRTLVLLPMVAFSSSSSIRPKIRLTPELLPTTHSVEVSAIHFWLHVQSFLCSFNALLHFVCVIWLSVSHRRTERWTGLAVRPSFCLSVHSFMWVGTDWWLWSIYTFFGATAFLFFCSPFLKLFMLKILWITKLSIYVCFLHNIFFW